MGLFDFFSKAAKNFSEELLDKLDDPNYEVQEDPDEGPSERICAKCGCSYTLSEAMDIFSSNVFGSRYPVLSGLCGDCAVEEAQGDNLDDDFSYDD